MNWSVIIARLRAGGLVTALAVLLPVLCFMFYGALLPGQTLFSNDGPLGQLMAQCHRLPDRFTGCWLDLNSVGFNGGAATPSISFALQGLLGPVLFSKLYAIISLLILGSGAWCFFCQLNLSLLARVLGSLAAVLNSTFFSVACWGVGAHDITIGLVFYAFAALADQTSPKRWLRVVLAGMALGMAVTEGADVGAIFSLFAALFVVYQACVAEGWSVGRAAAGAGRLTVVVLFAAFLAAQAVQGLVGTSISGVAGMEQDVQSKKERWDWATQWSLPKVEALNFLVPGLFGYRMDTLEGGEYWGTIGRDPAWEEYENSGQQGQKPTGFLRYNGGGNYAGALVVLVAVWAAAESFRRKNAAFTPVQRRWLWFWLGMAGLSLLLAFGRYAPFYQLVYALPYFSTIRNPTKFLYLFGFGLVVLFAYGMDGLSRKYMQAASAVSQRGNNDSGARAGDSAYEKKWIWGCILVGVAGVLGWWIYGAHRYELIGFLQSTGIGEPADEVANYSIHQAGSAAVMFVMAAGLMILIFNRAFAGPQAVLGGIILTVMLVGDLGVANRPWIIFWNYEDKYASNPVIDLLRDKPYEHRVACAPRASTPELGVLSRIYSIGWLEQLFPYYNIQAFETVEMPRVVQDFSILANKVNNSDSTSVWFRLARAWQVCSVRYVLGPADFDVSLSQQIQPVQYPLRKLARFDLLNKPGVVKANGPDDMTAVVSPDGAFGLFEAPQTMPRARLFTHWQVNTNDNAVLDKMFDPAYDPLINVFVAGGIKPSSADAVSHAPGSVEITSYAPKHMVLAANATAPSILLLTDHYDPIWKATVDGHPQPILRCNFLMRGIYLEPGQHTVEFKFEPPTAWLYVSLMAVLAALAALGILVCWRTKAVEAAPVPVTQAVAEPPASVSAKTKRKPEALKSQGSRRLPRR